MKTETQTKQAGKRAMALLANQFTRNGKVCCSAVHTDRGTMPLWGQLVAAGYVKHMGGISMGHNFEYELTAEGKRALDSNAYEN